MSNIIPYGNWPAVISSELIAANTLRLSEPKFDGGNRYWLESRPQEKGRNTIVRLDKNNQRQDMVPAPMNVRTHAHEYGGGSYCVDEGVIYFTNNDDQCIYRIDNKKEDCAPQQLTLPGRFRYADFSLNRQRGLLLCVCEQHFDHKPAENCVISINIKSEATDTTEHKITVLVSGNDFYSNPQLSPDGQFLSWLTWNHPNMPWDASECWLARVDADGSIGKPIKVAGDGNESVFQPQWSPDNQLFFVSDNTDWWNIYRYDINAQQTTAITTLEAEFATPQWQFGMSCYHFLTPEKLFCCYNRLGQWHLATVDMQLSDQPILSAPLPLLLTTIEGIHCQEGQALFIGASPTHFSSVYEWSDKGLNLLASSGEIDLDEKHIAIAEKITFRNNKNTSVHGFYYPPTHANCCGPADQLPPLIVMCHGGPTASTDTSLNLKIQYWTNRGFAVFDVNYTGSTGYGRHYRQRLYGRWGLDDVDDICSATNYLISKGRVDSEQVAVRGSSAGGYTVLAALTFRDTFKAGASLYGIGDLELLAADTHKFEAHYLDKLIGPYPEEAEVYRNRSPIHHTDQLTCPVIFFQGLEDKVVPPNQARAMVTALREKNIPVALLEFADEGHGFRKSENIKAALDTEYAFYANIFSLAPDGDLPKVPFVE